MKKTFLKLALIALASPIFLCACNFEKTTTSPKYVFYFISDGTGINTVLGTEMYHASLADTIGRAPLCMTQFPVVGVATTHSASSPVTDSAASGTALATGGKTGNGVIGKAADGKTDLYSIAPMRRDYESRCAIHGDVL